MTTGKQVLPDHRKLQVFPRAPGKANVAGEIVIHADQE